MPVAGRSPLLGASLGAAVRHAFRLQPVMATVVTAARFVVCVPVWVSGGVIVRLAVILHATGKAGADAPANMAGVPKTAKLVTGKASATTPNRTLRRVSMIPPRPCRGRPRPRQPHRSHLAC